MFLKFSVFPLLKSKYLKNFWQSYQIFLIKISSMCKGIFDELLLYVNNSWPHKYPEKIIFYIELVDNLIYFSTGEGEWRKILAKIHKSINDINFLVCYFY